MSWHSTNPDTCKVTLSSTSSSAITRLPASLQFLSRSLWLHRHLLWQLVQRDVVSRYRGSLAGILWSVLLPCIMLGVYVFVFGHVFTPARPVGQATTSEFALSLFTGMLLHGLMAECLARAPAAILAQPSSVKKVVFPVELLPLTIVGTAIVQFLIGSAVLLAALAITQGLPATAVLWPVAWLPLVAVVTGVSFILSALTVYLRDLAQMTGFLATVLLFLSPVFYPLESVSARLQYWMALNPLTIPIETARSLLLHGQWPDWAALGWYSVASLAVLLVGWWVFQRSRRGFSDVI
jgi:lipopolysaccharide transport system permease protein